VKYSIQELGKIGEDVAAELLIASGYEIIERNYKYGKGEIDIIALDPETGYTAFIEVKTRTNLNFGDPVYGVTLKKMKQLKKVALAYLYEKKITEILCRFDIIAIMMYDDKKPEITHYINAFVEMN
jgi:putative endonuclease